MGKPMAIGVVLLGIFLVWPADSCQWEDTIPDRFHGRWVRVQERDAWEPSGLLLIRMGGDRIGLTYDGVGEQIYPVRRVSLRSDIEVQSGTLTIFYGPLNDAHIADHRLQISFGRQQKFQAAHLFSRDYYSDDYFPEGEFVKAY